MLRQGRPPALSRILATRMILAALLVSFVLTGITFVKYALDEPYVHRQALEDDASAVAAAVAQGNDPARLPRYVNYPHAYAFRVYDHRLARDRHVVAAANTALLPPAPDSADLQEKFEARAVSGNLDKAGRWQLIEREQVDRHHHYWVQAAMVGDPDWRWREVIASELMDHVVVPALTIVPILTLVMFLTTRSAMRPLTRIADQASRIGASVVAGASPDRLPEAGLPREFAAVVTAINAMVARLERSLSVQKQFTADVAHELRTPLAVLLLEVARLPDAPARDLLTRDIGALSNLVNELLRFAQAENALAAGQDMVDIVAVVRRVCEDLAPAAIRRRVSLALDAPDKPVLLPGNAALMEIAIRNLVDNAVKFTAPRSTVTVQLDATGRISVDDRGPGVPEEQKRLIFERFWRGEHGGGAGVGLALVRRVAQLHAGDVQLEDGPNGGTRFVLTLGRVGAG